MSSERRDPLQEELTRNSIDVETTVKISFCIGRKVCVTYVFTSKSICTFDSGRRLMTSAEH